MSLFTEARKGLFILYIAILIAVLLGSLIIIAEKIAVIADHKPDFYLAPLYGDSVKRNEKNLQAYLDTLCEKYGYCDFKAVTFRHFISSRYFLNDCPSAFVMQNRTIFVWEPLVSFLTEKELHSVLAHEVAHIIESNRNNESGADLFAARLEGKDATISALKKTLTAYPCELSSSDKEKLKERIRILSDEITYQPF